MERRSRAQKIPGPLTSIGEALNRRIDLHTCRQQHTALRHILSEFPDDTPLPGAAMTALLSRLKNILYRHLKLEDDYVYPALAQAHDEALRARALKYRMEMGAVLRAFQDFDERWPHADTIDAHPAEFFEQWTAVRAAIERRMDVEDESLYTIAEDHFNSILNDA